MPISECYGKFEQVVRRIQQIVEESHERTNQKRSYEFLELEAFLGKEEMVNSTGKKVLVRIHIILLLFRWSTYKILYKMMGTIGAELVRFHKPESKTCSCDV